jgi:hypothetical protein
MTKIGRNDPCPCGSGKKYKKCCLLKTENANRRSQSGKSAVQTALDWLHKRYPEEVSAAVTSDFFGELTDEEHDVLESLPSHLEESISINIGEWLLNDSELSIKGKECRVLDLLFGYKGPLLTSTGREWLTEISKRSMSLYEVFEVKKGEGLLLKDLINTDETPVWVVEKTASGFILQWDIFGARLARKEEEIVLTGAVYPMERSQSLACLKEINSEIEGIKDEPLLVRKIVSSLIIAFWLDSLLHVKPLPDFVDAGTGDKLNLTTDRYKVLDWDLLTASLSACKDVDGSRGEGWDRFIELEDDRLRILASLTPCKGDILEVFCRTVALADDARSWLEDVAGDAIVYKIREITDPRSSEWQNPASPTPPEIPPEAQRQIIQEYLLKHYESWLETPLPALGGKSPLKAVKTKKWRPEVIELLKSIDQLEQGRIVETGGEALDIRFLWSRLGIDRDNCELWNN